MLFTLVASNSFKKSARKMAKVDKSIEGELQDALKQVKNDSVSPKLCKHKLDGCFKGMFSIHIRPDCILVYSKDQKENTIKLHMVGTHANIMENRKWSKRS